MPRTIGIVAFACALLLPGADAYADSLLRCGRDLLPEGASTYEVRMACGDPMAESRRTEWRVRPRVVLAPCSPGSAAQCRRVVQESVEVQVTEWTYDRGPQRFIRYVTFEQNRLVAVRNGERGHKRQ